MTRAEHLVWAKDRAIEYLQRHDLPNAIASLISDLGKHEETQEHPGVQLGMMLWMGGHLETEAQVRHWIEGFG